MKSDNCRHSLDGGDILLLTDDNGLCAERDNERTREQDGADNAVRLGTAERRQDKARVSQSFPAAFMQRGPPVYSREAG